MGMGKEINLHLVTPYAQRAEYYLLDEIDYEILTQEVAGIIEVLYKYGIIVDMTASINLTIENSTEEDAPSLAGLEDDLKELIWRTRIEN